MERVDKLIAESNARQRELNKKKNNLPFYILDARDRLILEAEDYLLNGPEEGEKLFVESPNKKPDGVMIYPHFMNEWLEETGVYHSHVELRKVKAHAYCNPDISEGYIKECDAQFFHWDIDNKNNTRLCIVPSRGRLWHRRLILPLTTGGICYGYLRQNSAAL